jgi:hypothetical protein
MPTIAQASEPITEFPNLYMSPFGSDGIIPLYSSIPIKTTNNSCLPCVVCGNSNTRKQIILFAASTPNSNNTINN